LHPSAHSSARLSHKSTGNIIFFIPPPPTPSTLFPYTTLFRSHPVGVFQVHQDQVRVAAGLQPALVQAQDLGRPLAHQDAQQLQGDRKSTRLNSSHVSISYAVFCLKKKSPTTDRRSQQPHHRPP